MRRTLPQRRAAETFDLRFWNQPFTVTVGFYADGTPGEVFIDGGKTGQDIQSTPATPPWCSASRFSTASPSKQSATPSPAARRKQPASILGAIVDALPRSRGSLPMRPLSDSVVHHRRGAE